MTLTKTTTITKAIAETISSDSPLLTAYQAGRVAAFRGLTCPAGASADMRRGYAEAEMEMATE
jgi:hypothetical protein